jgi:arylsulfatase A
MKTRLLFFTLPLCIWCDSTFAAGTKPNIVILYADDMGYGDLGVQNPDSKIPTPNLDRLAREGMRFTDAHSSSGVCTPSRYALLTGRFHWRKFHSIVNSFDPPVLDASELTLPEMLVAEGYRTACIGKWHLGWNWSDILKPGAKPQMDAKGRDKFFAPNDFDWSRPVSGGPLSHGFQCYFGEDVPNFPPYAWFENDRVITTPTVPLHITSQTAEGSWEARPGPMTSGWDFYAVIPRLTEQAVEWIGKQRGQDRPFFLYVPFNSPHAPIVPTNEFRGKSQAGGYGDFMVQTDDNAGRILRALEENGFAENTLVIFTADNGAERYAYDRVRNYGHRSSGPLRGLKRDLYEGGHRVPFLVKWPGIVKAGTVNDALISQVDLMATIASIVGYKLPANTAHDSYDLLSVWKKQSASPRHSIVHNTVEGAYAIRHDQWVLIAAKTGAHSPVPAWFDRENGYAKNAHSGELYDLSVDLGQKNNLYVEKPEKVRELATLLKRIRAKGQMR